jgi:hypothetical protein
MTDLEMIVDRLIKKQKHHSLYFNYYDGDQPLVYSSERLRQVFRDIDARFEENWCAVVVDSVLERLNLRRFVVSENQPATDLINSLMASTELQEDFDSVHLAALLTGEAIVIGWRDDTGIQAYYNDPRQVEIVYDFQYPNIMRVAGKWWQGEDEYVYLTLYYADRLEYYRTASKCQMKDIREAKEFQLDETQGDKGVADNPFGVIPMMHLRRERRAIKSELRNVITPQNAINKLVSDMMVAAEFSAFKQRWVISNGDTDNLKNGPNSIWHLFGGDGMGQGTQVGEFSQTDLNMYLNAIDKLALAVGVISRTPKHFFFMQAGDPSGEALIAMEAPLTHKARKYIRRWEPVWERFASFLLGLAGLQVDPLTIHAMFEDPGTIQPLTQAQIRQTNNSAGLPLLNQLRREGWADDELRQLAADRQEEMTANADLAQAYLDQARKNFDQGGGVNG